VTDDVSLGYVSARVAHDLYGVVVAGDGTLDPEATEARRNEIRTERLGGRPRWRCPSVTATASPRR
jgi:hypothetical protein